MLTGCATLGLLTVPMLADQRGLITYDEVEGVREFTGQMIVRPIQSEAWTELGVSRSDARMNRHAAKTLVNTYQVRNYVPQTDEYIIFVPQGMTENDVHAALMASGNFQYAEPDYRVFPLGCPSDPLVSSQYHHDADIMQSCDAWDILTGRPSIVSSICDTGLRLTHEEFQLYRTEAYNAVDQVWEDDGGQVVDINGHGTATTGCTAANGANGVGIAGVGWHLGHRMMRVSNSSGGGSTYSTLQHAARTAVENGDRLASVSYSGVDASSNLTTATYLKDNGGLLVWAAGNENRNLTLSSRDNDDIIVAGATDSNDNKASFSNFGVMVDVVAPGVDVFTASNGGNSSYGPTSGTSFSCPLTAGVCAMIWSADPTLSPDDVEAILKNGCDDLGANGIDNTFGYGRINTFNSVAAAGNPFDLQVDPLTGGQSSDMRAVGSTPGATVYFIYSLAGLGVTNVAALGVDLDLRNPKLGGSAVADGSGLATFTSTVPSAGSGLTVYLQAAEAGRTTDWEVETIN